MASGTIESIFKDTLITESATTGTYAEKLNSIFTASNNLTDVQAKNSYVDIGGYKYYFVTKNRYASLPINYIGKFIYTTLVFTPTDSHIESLSISNSGAISVEDASSITNNYKIRLYIGG